MGSARIRRDIAVTTLAPIRVPRPAALQSAQEAPPAESLGADERRADVDG